MEDLFNDILRGLDAKVYHLSLGTALCIPDICAALESEDGKASKKKYTEWYDKYVGTTLRMTSEDCYYFRCSFLHQGSTSHDKSQYDRVLFIEPHGNNLVMHNNIIDGVLNLDLKLFCLALIKAGKEWLNDIKDDEKYIRNKDISFRRYPNGLSPYIVGIPVYS